MYGQNGRIGLLVPSANTVAEPEFNRMVPDGIGVHAARMQYLEDEGIRVLTVAGMGIVDAFSIGKVTPQETYEFARRVWRGDAGGMFISCTNLRTIDVLARLEAELGAPVVSSNLATFRGCLRALGHRDPVEGYGRLLEEGHPAQQMAGPIRPRRVEREEKP